jgi:hypothetical protein
MIVVSTAGTHASAFVSLLLSGTILRQYLFGMLLILTPFAQSAPIGSADTGTFAFENAKGELTGMQMRLTRQDNKWRMEGKSPDQAWHDISCDTRCELTRSDAGSITRFTSALPATMQGKFDLTCIENVAGAFCRLTRKDNPAKGGYMMVALVAGSPVPMSLRRLLN